MSFSDASITCEPNPIPIVLHVILFFFMSAITLAAGGDGSPSLMMITCFCAASVAERPLTAIRMVVSKSGISPITILSMRFLMAFLFVANCSGTSQFTPPGDHEYVNTPK